MIPEEVAFQILNELCEEKRDLWKKEFLSERDLNCFNAVMMLMPIEFRTRIEGLSGEKK